MTQKLKPHTSLSDYLSLDPNTDRIAELYEELRALLASGQSFSQQCWSRSLPFGDYIVDRWAKAEFLGFGKGSSIYDGSVVLGDVKVGKNTWIGPFTILDGSGILEIGDNCSISAGVQIYTHDTVKWATSGGINQAEYAPVRVGNNSYIGPNVVISKGVNIGSGCVIGANSLLLIDVPDGGRAWGTPAKIIK
jgi:acetyltransferase-like isoleucine patch superfamily enzyme